MPSLEAHQQWLEELDPGHPTWIVLYQVGQLQLYRKTFDVVKPEGRLWLDLGGVAMLAEVRLNGQDLGVVWCPPWRVDITDVVKPVGNVLEVRVVNGWWNQLVGDPQHERTKTNIRLKPGAQPQTSGLLGPVTLRSVQPAQH